MQAGESLAHGEGAQRARCVGSRGQDTLVNTGDPFTLGGGHWELEFDQLPVEPQGPMSATDSWRTGCGESRTSGSASGQEKPTTGNDDKALLADSTNRRRNRAVSALSRASHGLDQVPRRHWLAAGERSNGSRAGSWTQGVVAYLEQLGPGGVIIAWCGHERTPVE